jgi:transcriptional regulator with XRE-family HTH domain
MGELAVVARMKHPRHAIRERRTELGWTQAELAERADVAQADISRIENARLDARWSNDSTDLRGAGVINRRTEAKSRQRSSRSTSTPGDGDDEVGVEGRVLIVASLD